MRQEGVRRSLVCAPLAVKPSSPGLRFLTREVLLPIMTQALVMTLIGQDRPGLVDSVAGLVAEQGGNWLESRMSRLGGHFAGILRVEVPSENEPALVAGLKKLESRGLTVVVHPDQPKPPPASARQSLLEIV